MAMPSAGGKWLKEKVKGAFGAMEDLMDAEFLPGSFLQKTSATERKYLVKTMTVHMHIRESAPFQ